MKRFLVIPFLGFGLCFIGCSDDDTQDAGINVDSGIPDAGTPDASMPDAGPCAEAAQSAYCVDDELLVPVIGVRTATAISVDGLQFKDSNGNGMLDPYEDWRLSPSDRAVDLVSRMETTQKIGLLTEGGLTVTPSDEDAILSDPQIDAVTNQHVRQTLLRWPAGLTATAVAKQLNKLQALAESLPLGIPMVFTTDPIFGSASDMESTMLTHQNMSDQITDWPLVLGLGAIDDEAYVKQIGAMQAAELRAVGIRWMLGPQADLATEPMWSRVYDTFGSRPDRVGALVRAYVQGFQGKDDGVHPLTGVAATIKHFPGGGANENGMDSHTEFGKYNVFPGNDIEDHILAMKTAIEGARPAAIMPCYSIFENASWNSISVEQVGASFAELFMVDLLRNNIGWDGFVTSDWGAIGFCGGGQCFSQSAWGTETWENAERMARYLSLGGHQIGLWADSRPMWEDALAADAITEDQITKAAQKALELAFKVGAFENPYVDEEAATATIDGYADEAHEAMMRAFTLLKNENAILPLDADSPDQNGVEGIQVYYDGHDDSAIENYAGSTEGFQTVTNIADADYAIIRLSARWGIYFGIDGGVPLSYRDPIMVYDRVNNVVTGTVSTASDPFGASAADNNAAAIAIAERIEAAIANKGPNTKLIVVVSMYRPFIFSDYLADVDVLAADFGMTDSALLDMVFQMRNGVRDTTIQPTGKLPMELPSSQDAVYSALEDVPHDSQDPTFEVGAGLTSY